MSTISQMDSMLLCVCSVIDHRWRQNVVRTSGTRGDSRVCHWCSAARQHGTYFYFILTEIFAQNRSHEKLIRQFLHPIRIAKRLSHTWEKRFVQSEISCQNESISSQRAHVVVGVSSVIDQRWCQNVVTTKKWNMRQWRIVTDVLTTFWRLLWSITEQTLGNMESICFI